MLEEIAAGGSRGATVNWGAVAVGLGIATFAGRSVGRAIRAPTVVQNAFSNMPGKARAVIEGDHVVPRLASLINAVNEESLRAGAVGAEAGLQRIDYLEDLEKLSEYYADYTDASRLPNEMERWLRWKGVAAVLFLIGFAELMVLVAISGVDFHLSIAVTGWALTIVGVTAWVISTLQEAAASNRLSAILTRYRTA